MAKSKEVLALGEQMKVLEEAKKAGIRLGGKLRSEMKVDEPDKRNKAIENAFKAFVKDLKAGKIADRDSEDRQAPLKVDISKLPPSLMERFFLMGFKEAFFDTAA